MSLREHTASLNRVSIQAVGGFLGLKLPRTGMVRCPFPDHSDRTPSFQIKKSGVQWICYGCQRRGGSIDFAKIYLGTDFLNAKQWLAKHAGFTATYPNAPRRQTQPIPIASSSTAYQETTEDPPDSELYHEIFQQAPLQQSGRQYLNMRGIPKQLLSDFRIGQVPNDHNFSRHLISSFGFPRCRAAGLLTKASTDHDWRFLFPPQSILFPFIEEGKIVYFQARLLTTPNATRKWRNLNNRKRRIYNVDAISTTGTAPLAICEGVIDALSAITLHYKAVGLVGVNTQLNKAHMRQLRGIQVEILLDWDTAGETRAIELQKELRGFGIASTRKSRPFPGIKDLNEYLIKMRAQPC